MSKPLKIISIDAFNSLFVPRLPIMKQYADIGAKYGFKLTQDQLSQKFPKAYKELRSKYPNYGKAQGLGYEEWWSKLLIDLYHPDKVSNEFITELMETFSSELGYSGYNDVTEFLNKYSQRDDVLFIGSSNGDPRVLKILESLNILKHFHKIYSSYDLEFTKPNEGFFNYILDDLIQNVEQLQNIPRETVLSSIWHVGDEFENDLKGAHNAGWKSILIDRQNEFKNLVNKTDDESLAKIKLSTSSQTTGNTQSENNVLELGDDQYVVNSFDQISKIIRLQ